MNFVFLNSISFNCNYKINKFGSIEINAVNHINL